ncbi:hypothetical protein LOC51_22615 [Rubrivivax sp. JA1024]|nr:hypothetical protein [Rubrivivax sp. JA1024]
MLRAVRGASTVTDGSVCALWAWLDVGLAASHALSTTRLAPPRARQRDIGNPDAASAPLWLEAGLLVAALPQRFRGHLDRDHGIAGSSAAANVSDERRVRASRND